MKKETTLLTVSKLKDLGFSDVGPCPFRHFTGMSYWVKNGVCLFYNVPVKTNWQDSFLVGFASMKQGEYAAVAFRWIRDVETLTSIYEGILGVPINNPI